MRPRDEELVRKIEAQKTTKVAHIFGGLLGRELPTPEKQTPVDINVDTKTNTITVNGNVSIQSFTAT